MQTVNVGITQWSTYGLIGLIAREAVDVLRECKWRLATVTSRFTALRVHSKRPGASA